MLNHDLYERMAQVSSTFGLCVDLELLLTVPASGCSSVFLGA